jgi:hypothetical protein
MLLVTVEWGLVYILRILLHSFFTPAPDLTILDSRQFAVGCITIDMYNDIPDYYLYSGKIGY